MKLQLTSEEKRRIAHLNARKKLLSQCGDKIGTAPIGDLLYFGAEPFWLSNDEAAAVVHFLLGKLDTKLNDILDISLEP